MKKILFGITGLTVGGAERVLVDIVNKLKKRVVLLDSGRIVKDYKAGEYSHEDI